MRRLCLFKLFRVTIHGLLAIALLITVLVVWGWLTRYELVLGPVVIRSQAGTSYPLAVPADGAFAAPPAALEPARLERGLRPRNLVLVIGDGMGLSMLSSVSALLHGPAGGLHLERAPVVGLVRTYASDALETDSAAAATALATGFKTRRKMVSTLPDGSEPMTLLEAGRTRGLATGVVTTSGLMDATPACFTAHDPSRKNEVAILVDQLRSGTEVLIGAAWGCLDQLEQQPELAAALAQARSAGYTIARSPEELQAAAAPLVALLPPRPDSPDAGGPPLEQSVQKALAELATDGDGFVLIVESEETDEWGHENNIKRIVTALEELEQAIGAVLAFAEQDGQTLVLITADHDTGGLGIGEGKLTGGSSEVPVEVRWTTSSHLGVWVPLFAFGPGAEVFAGIMDNTEIPHRIGRLLDLQGFPSRIRPLGSAWK